jgi:hypothetical protein
MSRRKKDLEQFYNYGNDRQTISWTLLTKCKKKELTKSENIPLVRVADGAETTSDKHTKYLKGTTEAFAWFMP